MDNRRAAEWLSDQPTTASAQENTMPKGQEKTNKDNKPKLTTADKQKKKKEKEAAKKAKG